MPKTVFIEEDPEHGIAGTPITAALMNALNNHRHRGLNIDGDGALDYAADTGAANAYVIALTPALPALVTGFPIWFKAAAANTGASTLAVNDIGAINIKKNVTEELNAGDIIPGKIIYVVFDGTNFQLMNPTLSNIAMVIKNTLANITLAATGDAVFVAYATDNKTAYLYPGDESVGLIIIGGTAAGAQSDVQPERG